MNHSFFVECEFNGQWIDTGSAEKLEAAISLANIAVAFYKVPTRVLGLQEEIPLVQLTPDELFN